MVQIPGDTRNGSPHEGDLRSQLRDLCEGLEEEVKRLRQQVAALNNRDDPEALDASLSPAEVADRLGISRRTLDDLEAKGEIQAIQVGGQVRYEPRELADFIRRNRRGGDRS